MLHHHTWRLQDYWLLSLPTPDGFAERMLTFACACGAWTMLTGELKLQVGLSLADHGVWETQRAAEQRQQTALAVAAAQQQRQRFRRGT